MGNLKMILRDKDPCVMVKLISQNFSFLNSEKNNVFKSNFKKKIYSGVPRWFSWLSL